MTYKRRASMFTLLPLLLFLAMISSTDALASWQGIDRADSRIAFVGDPPGSHRERHRWLRLKDTGGRGQSWEAHWMERGRTVPVFRLRLHMMMPDHVFRRDGQKSLEDLIKTHRLFMGLAYTAVESGRAETPLGSVEHLVYEAGWFRCGVWRLYRSSHTVTDAEVLGDTMMTGLFCPVSREVDGTRLTALLARTGIRGISVPETGTDPPKPGLEEVLARVVESGDMSGLRRIAAGGLDPDSVIPFSRPRFAGGRTIHRPMIVAAALFGHIEMTVFLLELGAATWGAAATGICAAIAGTHTGVVAVLLDADPALAGYQRCGRGQRRSAIDMASRPDRAAILELLRAALAR